MQKFDCLVIGGGSGGVRFARIAAARGAKVGIIEQQHWGGTCVNIGCVPKKMMVYGSAFGRIAESAKSYGWDFEKKDLDWQRFQGLRDAEISRLDGIYATNLEKAGATLIEGHARFLDSQTLEIESSPLSSHADSFKVTAPKIIIAAGGQPVRPDIPGAELGWISDDMFSLPQIPKRLAIIGGGYIALEFSGIFSGYASKVDLIYRQELPLRGFDEEIRREIAERLPLFGIDVHSGHSPLKIERQKDGLHLFCDGGLEVVADGVLFATGRQPDLAGLGLENTAVQLTKDGGHLISGKTDFSTTDPGIYAIGDVLDKVNLTPVALAQGQVLAEKLYPDPDKPVREWNFDIVPKAIFFSSPLSTVGLSEEEASKKEDLKIFSSHFTPLFASLEIGQLKEREKVFIKIIVGAESDRLLGVSMIGEGAADIIQIMAACVAAGIKKQELDKTLALHPTTAEEFVTLTSNPRLVKKQIKAE